MESKLLSPDLSDSKAEAAVPAPEMAPKVDALSEVCQAIVADARILPKQYLEEILVPASGE